MPLVNCVYALGTVTHDFMAGGEQTVDIALNVDIVSCENIRHVLLHADNKSTNDLISDLEDIEQEDLCVARE